MTRLKPLKSANDGMKTLKTLKTMNIWNSVFCVSWAISLLCLLIDKYYDILLVNIGLITIYGWMTNPFAIISCFQCLIAYLADRKNPTYKQLIGKKWVWIFIWPIITTLLFIIGGGLFVEITGGV